MNRIGLFIIHDQPDFDPEIKYTFKYICNHPLIKDLVEYSEDAGATPIYYLKEKSSSIDSLFIPAQNLIFSSEIIKSSGLSCNIYNYSSSLLYSVEHKKSHQRPFLTQKKFSFDLIETIFFHISRYEEYHADDVEKDDETLWLKEEKHFLIRHELEKHPIVDQLITAFGKIVTGQKISQRTQFNLTHDIDILYRYKPHFRFYKSLIGGIYHKRGIQYLRTTIVQYINFVFRSVKDPFDTFDFLFSDRAHFKYKVAFFMTGGETKYDNLYSPNDPSLLSIIDTALNCGYQIGLHPSFNAGQKKSLFISEKAILESKIKSICVQNRQHWLRWDWDITPNLIERLNFKVDSSLGYNDYIGFRCGTGYPYQLYNFNERTNFSFVELPMIFMESALIKEKERSQISKKIITREFHDNNLLNTMITYNFHNSNFDESLPQNKNMRQIYKELINESNF